MNSAEQLTYLKNLVRLRLDEYAHEEGETPEVNYGDIEAELKDSAAIVLLRADRKYLLSASVALSSPAISEVGRNGIKVSLPADYLRFLRCRVKGWDIPLMDLRGDDDPTYRLQQYNALRATKEKPAGYLVANPGADTQMSKEAVELFPAGDKELEEFIYVPRLAPGDMPSQLTDALVWHTVHKMMIIGEREGAEVAYDKFTEALATGGAS